MTLYRSSSKSASRLVLPGAIADVLAAKSLMQQSLFDERTATYDPPWRRPLILAMLLAGSALIAAFTALAIVLLR